MRESFLLCFMLLLAAPVWLRAADLKLVEFDNAKPALTDARTAPAAGGLSVSTGHSEKWPGVSWTGNWDLAAFACIETQVRNTGKDTVTVFCRVDSSPPRNISGYVRLEPGQAGTIKIKLKRTVCSQLGGRLFGMRGYPAAPGGNGVIDPQSITQLRVFLATPDRDHEFVVTDLRATGDYVPPTAWVTDADPYLPFIDTYGQYQHKDWPGKVRSLGELRLRRDAEARELVSQPGPEAWDKYGGWAAGPPMRATGFFRVEKYNGRWWLVDPIGNLFFSHGVNCVEMQSSTPIAERADWFADFPEKKSDFKPFLSGKCALNGHYGGQTVESFSFEGANLLRKYGEDWKAASADIAHKRIRSWGLNTIANWSDPGVCVLRRTPYTDTISSGRAKRLKGGDGYWEKFPDVYDPGFAEAVRVEMSGKLNFSAADPWCLGYFSDNEMSWGDDTSLAVATLQSPPEQVAKKVFIADLKEKYGDIGKLNAAWGTHYESWDALLELQAAPDKTKARADLTEFYAKTAEAYFRIVRDAIKSIAPNQLYLGCRFAWVNDLAAIAAGKYCDVVSYNLYRRSLSGFKYPGGDKPLIVGEFHFGALDRGMFHPGLVPVESQAERAAAYREYVESALRHPQFVGTHWFQWKDEPTTGRVLDEENYQIGLLDGTDTPYTETIAATRAIGEKMYRLRP